MIVDSLRVAPIDAAAPAASIRRVALWLCAAAFLAAWLPRLHWGFWTDEAGTFWMAAYGWREAIARTLGWAGQSAIYSAVESFFVADGFWREPLLRVPSLIAMAIAALHLKRIGTLLIGSEAGWIAVAVLVCSPDGVTFGTSARPYAPALAASLASFRYLIEWRLHPTTKAVAQYLAASILALYLHYLFGFIFLIQAVYLGYAALRRQRVPLSLPIAAAVVLPLSMLPILRLLRAAAASNDFSYAVPPEYVHLLQVVTPPVFLLGLGLGGVLLFVSGRASAWRPPRLAPETWVLLLVWLIAAPLCFFAVSRWTPRAIFAARYLLFIVPAIALLVAWAVAGVQRRESKVLLMAAVFAASVLHPGIVLQNWRPSPSSWREPLEWIAAQAETPPVFVASGMANTGALAWQKEDPRTSSYFGALLAYPIRNRALPLPYQFNRDVQEFVRSTALAENRYLLLAAGDSALVPWMSAHMRAAGFRAETHPFNDYVVVDYRRAH